jgi:hypothetical protein
MKALRFESTSPSLNNLMTDFPDSHRDLLDAQFASFATIGGNGVPQVTEVWYPYRYLEVRGNARLEPDNDYAFARKLGEKYDADLRVHDRPGETRVVVTIEPVNVRAVDMTGG